MRPPLSYVPLLPWALLMIVAIATLNGFGYFDPDEPAIPESKRIYAGVVTDIAESSKGLNVSIELTDTLSRPFKALLTVGTSEADIEIGDSLKLNTRLSIPRIDDSSPDAFDYPAFLRRKGVTATGYVSASDLEVVAKSRSILTTIRRWQRKGVTMLKRSELSDGCADFLATALLGDSSSLPEDTRRIFSESGQAHILALSGLHVGIIAGIILVILFPLTLLRMRTCRLTATVALLWCYAVLTGLSPSVVRAVIMATCLSGGYILQRHHVAMNSLLLAAILILAFSPTQLFDVGFQMSFLSVGCILIFMSFVGRVNLHRSKTAKLLLSGAAMPIFATLGCGMLSAYYFHTFPVYFLPANLLATPLVAPLMGGGATVVILECLNVDSGWLCPAVNFVYDTIYSYAGWIGRLPNAVIGNIYISPWTLVAYYAAIAFLALSIKVNSKEVWAAFSSTMAISAGIIAIATVNADAAPPKEYFIPRDSRHTGIIYFDGENASVIVMGQQQAAVDFQERSLTRHRDFMGRRGLDSMILVPDSAITANFVRIKNRLSIHGTNYLFISSDTALTVQNGHVKIDYAVVCNGFKGNVLDIADILSPDTILLSSNLNVRRHNRYIDSLQTHGIPHRSLRLTPHRVTIP